MGKKYVLKSNDYLGFLNTIANEQANTNNFDDLTDLIIHQLKKISNAIFVSFFEYDSTDKLLKNMKISAEQPILDAVIQVAGEKILDTEIPVDDEHYQEIVNKRIKFFPNLYEDSYGAVGPKISSLIQKALKIDKLWGLAYIIDNKLYGTSIFTLKKGQQEPDRGVLDSFINISAISLRRLHLESKIRQSEKESKNYLKAIDSMDLGLFIVNSDYSVRYMNSTMVKWFGDQTGLICYKSVAELTEPCPYCKLKEVIEKGENVTYTPQTEDGRIFNIHGSLLHNSDGTTSKLEIIQDITELRKAHKHVETLLQEKEIILKEVHHRIKNNMMTIMGLLTFQEQSITDEKTISAFENTRNRVQSMMVLYDKLYRSSDYQTIRIKDYFETLLEDIIDGFPEKKNVNLKCRIEDIQIEPKIVF
ncbi:MAG: hypothetical protein KAR21_26170, partial [Spirochaetales bacterium]|nr:hypothetical protein [Spirochaetales bacterium]